MTHALCLSGLSPGEPLESPGTGDDEPLHPRGLGDPGRCLELVRDGRRGGLRVARVRRRRTRPRGGLGFRPVPHHGPRADRPRRGRPRGAGRARPPPGPAPARGGTRRRARGGPPVRPGAPRRPWRSDAQLRVIRAGAHDDPHPCLRSTGESHPAPAPRPRRGSRLRALNALLDSTSAAPTRFLGAVLNSGTAWAGVAVAAGAVLGRPRSAVVAGWLSGTVGLSAFYVVAARLHDLPLPAYAPRMAFWWAVALVCCAPLGFVGTLLRRRGTVGLLARLVVPWGAGRGVAAPARRTGRPLDPRAAGPRGCLRSGPGKGTLRSGGPRREPAGDLLPAARPDRRRQLDPGVLPPGPQEFSRAAAGGPPAPRRAGRRRAGSPPRRRNRRRRSARRPRRRRRTSSAAAAPRRACAPAATP